MPEYTQLAPQLIRTANGTLRELGRVFCSGCRKPMPEPGENRESVGTLWRGMFHLECWERLERE